MTLDTKNLNESQLAEIQKQIDEIAAANKPELPLHLREPKRGESYASLHSDGQLGDCEWSVDEVSTARLDRGIVSLDPKYLKFTDAQRIAYTKILRFIAENGLEIVEHPLDAGYAVFVDYAEGWVMRKLSEGDIYNHIPKLKHEEHAKILIEKCHKEIRAVLSWYVPEVNNDNN